MLSLRWLSLEESFPSIYQICFRQNWYFHWDNSTFIKTNKQIKFYPRHSWKHFKNLKSIKSSERIVKKLFSKVRLLIFCFIFLIFFLLGNEEKWKYREMVFPIKKFFWNCLEEIFSLRNIFSQIQLSYLIWSTWE